VRQSTRHVRAGATASLVLVLLAYPCADRVRADAAGEWYSFAAVAPAVTHPGDASPPQTAVASISKHIEADLVLEPRAAAPGAAIRLAYTISSYEAQDERVRVRIEAGPGWKLLDGGIGRRELLLEKWENIEGELYLVVPGDARVGDRQLVRLIVELLGETGMVQAQAYVSVSRRGGARPGVPIMSSTATMGVSRLGAGGFKAAQKARSMTMSTRFGRSTFSLFYDRGLRENLSNFRFEEQRTRLSGNLRHRGWDVSFGNYVSSPGDAIAGPTVLGRGFNVSRPTGPRIAELVVAQPNTIGGTAGGHLLRGRIGVRRPGLSVAFSASSFDRPEGGYTTLSAVQQTVLDIDAEERLEIERRVTRNAGSNRVMGLGLDTDFRPSPAHRFSVRTGGLWLSNASGAQAGGVAAEATYAYTSKPATANVRWRTMPATVQGISIFGDEVAADGSVRLAGDLRLVGYVYRNDADTVGTDLSSSGEGTSVGFRLARGKRRIEVRGNYRDVDFTTRNRRHTVSVGVGAPIGPLAISAVADVGQQENAWQTDRIAFYRGDLRWAHAGNTVTATVTQSQGGGASRLRADLLAALKLRSAELAGGTWVTRGYTSGGRPGAWTAVTLPIGGGRLVSVGVDYSSLTWTAAPSLRGVFTITQAFAVPFPFSFARSVPVPPED
jgi:hypothetical protein